MYEPNPAATTQGTATAPPNLLLPAFKQPRRPPTDPPLNSSPEENLRNPSSPAGATDGGSGDSSAGPGHPGRHIPSPATTGARTDTSGTDGRELVDVDPAVTVAAVAAVVALVFSAAGLLLRWQKDRQLRQPTKPQRRDMAKPLASILRRHFPAAVITGDLADVAELAAAFTAYAEPAPLLVPIYPDAGLIDNPNNSPEEQ